MVDGDEIASRSLWGDAVGGETLWPADEEVALVPITVEEPQILQHHALALPLVKVTAVEAKVAGVAIRRHKLLYGPALGSEVGAAGRRQDEPATEGSNLGVSRDSGKLRRELHLRLTHWSTAVLGTRANPRSSLYATRSRTAPPPGRNPSRIRFSSPTRPRGLFREPASSSAGLKTAIGAGVRGVRGGVSSPPSEDRSDILSEASRDDSRIM